MGSGAHTSRAQLLLERRRHGAAEEQARLAVSEDPENAFAHYLLALALIGQDKLREGKRVAGEAVGLAPDEPLGHFALAMACFNENDLKGARRAIDGAIELDPEDPDYRHLSAGIHARRSRWADALAEAEAGLEHDAEHVDLNNVRALALTKLGRRSEAGATLDETLARAPEDADTHASYGWALLERGGKEEREKALGHFREALRLDPEHEFAKAGIVEGLKSGNILYRGVLNYFFWMGRLSPSARWGVLIGGLLLVNAVARSGSPLAGPVVGLYLFVVLMTWAAPTLFNTALRFHRTGRHALSRDQTVCSNWAALVLTLTLGLGAAAVTRGSIDLGAWAVASLALLLPLAGTFACHNRDRRFVLGAITWALAAYLGYGVWLDADGTGGDGAFTNYLIGIALFSWLGGFIMGGGRAQSADDGGRLHPVTVMAVILIAAIVAALVWLSTPPDESAFELEYEEIPGAENGYQILLKATEDLKLPAEGEPSYSKVEALVRGEGWEGAEATRWLDDNQTALAAFDNAAEAGSWQAPPIRSPEARLTAADIRRWGNLNAIRARRLLTGGDGVAAAWTSLRSVEVAFGLAGSKINLWHYDAALQVASASLQDIREATTTIDDPEVLEALETSLARRSHLLAFDAAATDAVRASYHQSLLVLDAVLAGRSNLVRGPTPPVAWILPKGLERTITARRLAEIFRGPVHGVGGLSTRALFQVLDESRDKALHASPRIIGPDPQGVPFLVAVGPGMLAALPGRPRIEADTYAARLTVALRRYQLHHGGLPETLERLAPDFIPTVPLDPYDGALFRYDSGERRLYSIGAADFGVESHRETNRGRGAGGLGNAGAPAVTQSTWEWDLFPPRIDYPLPAWPGQ